MLPIDGIDLVGNEARKMTVGKGVILIFQQNTFLENIYLFLQALVCFSPWYFLNTKEMKYCFNFDGKVTRVMLIQPKKTLKFDYISCNFLFCTLNTVYYLSGHAFISSSSRYCHLSR